MLCERPWRCCLDHTLPSSPACLNRGGHVCHPELSGLEAGDGAAKLLPRPSVLARGVQAELRTPHAALAKAGGCANTSKGSENSNLPA